MALFSKDIQTMDDLYTHMLQDIYYAENQIVKALPDMIQKAGSSELKQGFELHLQETQGQLGVWSRHSVFSDSSRKASTAPQSMVS